MHQSIGTEPLLDMQIYYFPYFTMFSILIVIYVYGGGIET